ncbi:MAG: hypothetical protein ACPGVD_10700 [Flavobacteriales bacterium]
MLKFLKLIGFYDIFLIFFPEPKLVKERNRELEGTIWDSNRNNPPDPGKKSKEETIE